MKKIAFLIFIIILISTIFVRIKFQEVFNNTYDLIFKNDEIGITFILKNNVNIILINDEDNITDLLVLDYENIDDLKSEIHKFNVPEIRKIYNITPVLIDLYGKESEEIKKDKNNIIKFSYNKRDFCVYINESNTSNRINCDFIYIYKFNKNATIEFGNKTELVFQNYNNSLPVRIQEILYQNWIDVYTINSYEYTTLKILKDGFDTIIIPIIK